MELADRSFSDLIRRLPIIILEDSFLHDDFDFLVWLMVAESKVRPQKTHACSTYLRFCYSLNVPIYEYDLGLCSFRLTDG